MAFHFYAGVTSTLSNLMRAVVCTEAPAGHARWLTHFLALLHERYQKMPTQLRHTCIMIINPLCSIVYTYAMSCLF